MENNTELGRLLSGALQAQIEEPGSLSQMEQMIREQLLEIGRQALVNWLAKIARQKPERTLPCPHCGQAARYERRREGQPKRPDGEWQIQAEQVSYYTDICASSAFSSLLWATGVQRHAQLARELVFLGDGAEWIWNIVQENFPQAVQILDWFHACEYLTPVAKAAFDDEAQQEAWVQETKTALWEGRLDEAIAACWALADERREQDPAAMAATYFQKNRKRMNYPAYRAKGYHNGSGTIESAAKQIGTQRMKVPGARWNERSARRVAKARAAFLSGQWPSLARRRAQLPLAA